MKRGRPWTFLRALGVVWILAGLSLTTWMWLGFQSTGVPASALRDSSTLRLMQEIEALGFQPVRSIGSRGLIFLPGGFVDPVAYVPLVRSVAESGYPARLLYLPMRCGCTESQVSALFDEIDAILADGTIQWVLAGHSRGAMLASRYAQQGRGKLAGLALIGTVHPRDFSLADLQIPVVKIYGTLDGIAPMNRMFENRHLLPAETHWEELRGGNHVQFGFYSHQLGDNTATISRDAQLSATRTALLRLLSGSFGL